MNPAVKNGTKRSSRVAKSDESILPSDSRSMAPVSDDVYRFMPISLAGGDIKTLHGTNEHVSLVNLESMIKFYARLIATAAG